MPWQEFFNTLLNKYGLLPRFDDLMALSEELLRWNKTHNLTAYKNWPEIAVGLMADSLLLTEFCIGNSCLDIGSGSGFPGLMLALARPEMWFSLLDARRKRVSFQRHACRMLKLANVKPLWGRAGQDNDPIIGKKYDTVTCKALSGLGESLNLCKKYASSGGRVVLPRGSGDYAAMQQLNEALAESSRIFEYELPLFRAKRFVLIIDIK